MAFHKQSEKWSGSTTSTSDSDSMKRGMSANVCEFRAAIKKLLSIEEQEDIRHILKCYHRNNNVYYLAESLRSILDTPQKRTLFPILKQIIPKSDRSSFDQYTCEETYVRSMSSSSRMSSMSQLRTNDSGIGSNQAGYCSTNQASTSTSSINAPSVKAPQPPRRSSSMSDLSHKSFQKNSRTFSASTFGSAVRRKVKAVLARRGSSSSVELKSSVQRRYSSETQLNQVGLDEEHRSVKAKRSGSFKDKLRPKRPAKQKGLVCISLVRRKGKEFGFTIGGGTEVGSGIFISEVDPGSAADIAGLRKRDVIMKVNEIPFNAGISHDMAVGILSSVENLTMFVKPYKSKQVPDDVPWVDVHGRPASPPHSLSKKNQYAKPVLDSRRSSLHLLQAGERRVTLSVNSRQRLGLMIRGGSEYGLGIYVTGVDSLSAAENAGLKAGDEILEVNNVSLDGASHAEAVSLIKSSPLLIMTVRYVGKIPQNQQHTSVSSKMVDDRISLHSSNTSRKIKKATNKENKNGIRATFQKKMMANNQMILPNMLTHSPLHQSAIKVSSTMATLEEALLASDIWMTLSDSERRCLRYYVKEYAMGSVTPDALVLALSELLDTPKKSTLMSAVRECISGGDLDRFDVLVLRREVETLRNSHQPPPPEDVSFDSCDLPSRTPTPEDFYSSLVSASPANPKEVDDSPPGSFCHHSTPNNSLNVSKNVLEAGDCSAPKLSPVPPSVPPPLPTKAPPTKPKRRSSTSRKTSTGSQRGNEVSYPSPPKKEDPVYSVVNKVKKDDRPASPFAIALENHISSHSGRVKALTKTNTHPSIPSPEFYEEPKLASTHNKPTFSSFIKPVKNPTIKLLKERNQKSILNTPPERTTSNTSASISAASSTSSLSDSVDLSLSKLSFRPVSFGASVNEKVAKSKPFPIKADVHTQPSTKNNSTKNSPKPIVIRDYDDPFTTRRDANAGNYNTDDATGSTDDDDDDNHPCLADDVDTQKIVIFKTASTLGLTIEGGAGTKQPLPRVLKIQRGSCAQMCGRIKTGHVIHEVNGRSLKGLGHHDVVRVIALAFKQDNRDSIELVLSGPF